MPRDPNRIDPIVDLVSKIWKANPDLRLSQLILNCTEEPTPTILYNLEDDKLVERMLKIYGAKNSEKGSS